MPPGHVDHRAGLRAVALFELFKGLLVLLAGVGALKLMGENIQAVAERLVRRSHLNPAHHYPRIFIEAAGSLDDRKLVWLAVAAAVYSIIRFAEAYGLWWERHWAEWLAVISASLYVPLEIYELVKYPTWVKVGMIAINLLIIGYLALVLRDNRRERLAMSEAKAG